MKSKIFCALAMFVAISAAGKPERMTGEPWMPAAIVTASHGGNEIRLYGEPLAYEVLRHGKTVVAKTPISLTLNGVRYSSGKLLSSSERTLSGTVRTPVYKKASVDLAGRETSADFGAFAVLLVARADGVAYRFVTKGAATVDDESAPLTIPIANARCWFNRTEQVACEETVPEIACAGELKTDPKLWYYLPFVYSVDGTMVAVTESDIHDYPAVNYKEVRKSADGVFLSSHLARYPKKIQRLAGNADIKVATGGRWIHVTEEESYLAKLPGAAELPWRVFVLADAPEKLCEADIVCALARPQSDVSDFKWVKPGKVQWEWWSAFDNQGDPQGCTTATYLRFIDFAAQNGVEYVIMDEGWSENLNIWKYNPKVDVPRIIDYANKKGVGIILWMAWAQVYGEEEKVAAHFAKLGAKGFKVDFMDRGDADMTIFLEKFAAACARHKMVIDYHGAYRPVGLQRTYPNILNYEGIHGLERMKTCGTDKDMTCNDVMCFFLRMTAGPMDYTPGAMLNYKIGAYGGNWTFPGSVGTRVHQMAQLVLYEAPLQMLCDSPTNYERNRECFAFMAKTPTVWDATVGLPGTPETIAAVARKSKDGSWYAAAITNKDARDYAFSTAFLGSGEWNAEIFRDTADGGEFPRKYVHETKRVKAGETLKFRLAEGGGFVVHFKKETL